MSDPIDGVFINCPFDAAYRPMFEALVFTVKACGFQPRSAREADDGGQPRIEKIVEIIRQSPYGIHDLSRTELDAVTKLPRFNMPFELGLFIGAGRYGDDAQRSKKCLIFDVAPYRYQQFISDIAGQDVHAHEGEVNKAIADLRNWLVIASGRKGILAPLRLTATYADFLEEKPAISAAAGLDVADIPWPEYETMVDEWLQTPRPAAEEA